jgi:cytochrome c553
MKRCGAAGRALARLALLCVAGSAIGAQGDAAAGKRKASTCNACHAVSGFKAMPKLAGSAQYIVSALAAYERQVRPHRTMQDVARGLNARDAADLGAFYSSLGLAPGSPAAAPPEASHRCATCHGEQGREPVTPDVPVLAGQSVGYLEQTLKEYRSAERAHPVMNEQARTLSDEEISTLAAWYAQTPGLSFK